MITVYRQSEYDTETQRRFVGVSLKTSGGYFHTFKMLDKSISNLDSQAIVRKAHRVERAAFLRGLAKR